MVTITETIARALRNSDASFGGMSMIDDDAPTPAYYSDLAQTAITALTEAGFAVVPVEPTEHAMDCGAYRLPGVDAASKQEKARDIYRAMIEAGRASYNGA